MKFSGVISIYKSDVHAKVRRSRSQQSKQTLPQLGCFQTVSPVWIRRWLWNDAHSLKSIEEVPYCFSRSSVRFQGHTHKKMPILTRIRRFRIIDKIRRFGVQIDMAASVWPPLIAFIWSLPLVGLWESHTYSRERTSEWGFNEATLLPSVRTGA